ncbi:unnamed protein product [Callosobruchus maculatus]|uniref:Uncharacterized protein n=1 Tax=Callosobruchus maculatus TaxID=64391 RepID=A0A653DV02_CALMS|nr:unnamed protein product [Callosobruchus maculatus]
MLLYNKVMINKIFDYNYRKYNNLLTWFYVLQLSSPYSFIKFFPNCTFFPNIHLWLFRLDFYRFFFNIYFTFSFVCLLYNIIFISFCFINILRFLWCLICYGCYFNIILFLFRWYFFIIIFTIR